MASHAHAQQDLAVHLSFEAQNYAPAEYLAKARALPIPGTSLILSASVFSKRAGGVLVPVDAKNYVFRWSLGGARISEGVGRNIITYNVKRYESPGPKTFSLQVVDGRTENILAETKLSVEVTSPKVLLYQITDNKISQVSQTAFSGPGGSILQIAAKPYFFNIKNVAELSFRWLYRGREIVGSSEKPELLAVELPKTKGQEQFLLFVGNLLNPAESASQTFSVESK